MSNGNTQKKSGKPRYVMTMDTRRCVGCGACVLACKSENDVPDGCYRDWIVTETGGSFPDLHQQIRSERCNHCELAPCVDACPTGASHYNDGGTVIVAINKCSGCKFCVVACPYGARYIHPEGHIEKCTFCLHRVREGLHPACVSTCPTRALTFGDKNDPRSKVSRLLRQRKYKVLKPEKGIKPNHFFLL
jgi:Fe-S-cluster-containing dehydrogenase component